MGKMINLKLRKFGYLRAIEPIGTKNTQKVWKCWCSFCGSYCEITSGNLLSGNSTRCKDCSHRRFSLSESKEIYKDRYDNKMTMEQLFKKYNCGNSSILSALKLVKKRLEEKD